jgi:hypothetical protein
MMPVTMTQREHELVDAITMLMPKFAEVIRADEETRDEALVQSDLREVANHIHALQDKVLAQAAARAYPDRYRLMGRVVSG